MYARQTRLFVAHGRPSEGGVTGVYAGCGRKSELATVVEVSEREEAWPRGRWGPASRAGLEGLQIGGLQRAGGPAVLGDRAAIGSFVARSLVVDPKPLVSAYIVMVCIATACIVVA